MSNIIDKIQLSGVTYDIGGQGGSGVSVVEVTQAEYDALPSSAKTDTSKMYVITDAEAGDLTNYYTKTETNTLLGGKADTATTYTKTEVDNTITAATSTKQDTLVSGENIKTINNISILGSGNIDVQGGGGGGKAIEAGTNISVTTGETADTINCTLPITAETGSTKCLIKIGANLNVSNGSNYEWAIGRYNVTRTKASGSWANSGNTAFSIGIGTPWNSYNGLEVRQNGDVYIADTRTGTYPYEYKMIKLQDAVAALDTKQTTLTAGTGISIVDNVISATGGGGGKAIEAGRGISITTGETADTVSFNLPISAGTGTNSIKENNATSANGNYSHSEGFWTRANGLESHAEGFSTIASGESTHAEGSSTQANGISSHAEGANTNANGDYSHTEGNCTKANNQSEHASGQYNVSSSASTTFGDGGNTLFSVGNGTANNARHNAFEIRQNGDIYLSSGGTDIKLQDALGGGGSSYTAGDGIDITNDVISVTGKADTSAVTEVNNVVTAHTADTTVHVTAQDKATWNAKSDFSGDYNDLTNKLSAGTNITIVDNVISATGGGGGSTYTAGRGIDITNDTISISLPISAGTGTNSIIENDANNVASGQYSHAEGQITSATTDYAHAEGKATIARGAYSHAEGWQNTASGQSSHAEGKNTKAGGDRSHAEGWQTISKGSNSHAEGSSSYASGQNSHAEGFGTSALTDSSHAEGISTKTTNISEHASGQYNVSSSASTTFGDSGNTLFSVGNGTATARHNAFEIRQNGDIYLNDGTKLQDTITATASNTTALGGLSLVKLSQAEYDALATKDSNTLYVIVN